MLSRRSFIKKAGSVPLIGAVGMVTGSLVSKIATASETVLNLADNANGAWADATSWAPGFEPYWAVINPFNQRSWYNGSCWASAGTPTKAAPQSLTVHLGGGIPNISKVCIYSVQNNYTNPNPNPPDVTAGTYPHANYFAVKDFTVEAWDGLAWHTVADVTNNEFAKLVITFSTPIRTDRFRIQVTATQPYTQLAMIAGFEAWGNTDYVDLTNKYNVIATTTYNTSGMLQVYDGLAAANAAAAAQQAYNSTVYAGAAMPTLSIQAATRPRMHAALYTAFDFGGGGGGGITWEPDVGGFFDFTFTPESGYTNDDVASAWNDMSEANRAVVDQDLKQLLLGGGFAIAAGIFTRSPSLLGIGAALTGAAVLGYNRDFNNNVLGTPYVTIPTILEGYGLIRRFQP